MIVMRPLREFRFPVTADCVTPDIFGGKICKEIEELKVWEGNKQKTLGNLFKIEEFDSEKANITIYGDVSKVRRIGACMKQGEIAIQGNVGTHVGEEMRGGKITVYGNVGGWAGSMMKNGTIEIHGNASDYMGAPYRGSSQGMRGGRIIVHGNVGSEAGAFMRNGVIKIYGGAGQFVGFHMVDGTIYAEKDCEERAGACMLGGKVIIGGSIESVLPTFTIDSIKPKAKIEEDETVNGPLYVFLGDVAEEGNGKLYVHKEKNPHLSHFERFL